MKKEMRFFALAILGLSLLSASALAKDSFKLNCESVGTYDGSMMYRTITFDSTLTRNSESEYTLSDLRLYYGLSMDEPYGNDWATADIYDADYTLTNYANYRPRVYKDHIKFADVYGNKVFGYIDLLLPKYAVNTEEKEIDFTGHTIMTWMDDHWGGSVTLNCSLTSLSESLN